MNKQILLVEEGSVYLDEVKELLPNTDVIVYRKGSTKPEFVDTPEIETRPTMTTCAAEILLAIRKVFANDIHFTKMFDNCGNSSGYIAAFDGNADDFIEKVRSYVNEENKNDRN